jgi:hypothetical protein
MGGGVESERESGEKGAFGSLEGGGVSKKIGVLEG